MSPLTGTGVTASVACFQANRYVRKAVESLLAQTHRDLTVVVVNDGDPNPPWEELAHLNDPRLVRFSLEANHGPYFIHQVVLAASNTPYFLIQDADDWSAPDRVATLLRTLLTDNSGLAFSAWQQYRQGEDGIIRPDSIRWRRKPKWRPWNFLRPHRKPSNNDRFLFDPVVTGEFINRASHHGVFRRTALEKVGGYYGGFRINYDTLLTNLLLMTDKVSFVEAPLYHYLLRPDSLSHSEATGARSQMRVQIRARQTAVYREALRWYQAVERREITGDELVTRVRGLVGRCVSPLDREAIARESARLAAVIGKMSQP